MLEATTVGHGGLLRGELVARNTGRGSMARVQRGDGAGVVKVGVHLYGGDRVLRHRDYGRIALPGTGVAPGGEVATQFEIAAPRSRAAT